MSASSAVTSRYTVAVCIVLGSTGAACTPPQQPPLVASSAAEPAYAEQLPQALANERTSFADREAQVKAELARFPNYPKALKAAPAQHVLKIVELADAAGRAESYAAGRAEAEAVQGYYAQEDEGLNRKVGGAASYAAKQAKCEYDAYAPPVGAMKKGIEKSVEDRLRSHNPAHRYLDDHAEELGSQNIEALRSQADAIALASYNTYVGTELALRKIRALNEQISDVKATLAQEIEQERFVELNPSESKRRRDIAAAHGRTLSAAAAELELEKKRVEEFLPSVEERTKQLKANYDQSLQALKQAIGSPAAK